MTIIKGKKPVFLYIKYNEILVKLHTKVSIQILTIEDDEDPDILWTEKKNNQQFLGQVELYSICNTTNALELYDIFFRIRNNFGRIE